MIAFLSLVATTEAQMNGEYGAPAQQGGDSLPDYYDAVIVGEGPSEPINPETQNLFRTEHHAGSRYHGMPTTPALGANPMPLGAFRGPLPTPAPEGTPSSVGAYEPGCQNPCQGWASWNVCTTPCTDADRLRINQQWQQHYNNPIPQIQQVQPTPAELMGSAELNQIENELVVGKNLSVDLVETEKKAAIEKIQANANLDVAKVVKMAQLAQDVVDLTGLNNAEVALDRVIDEEAQREEQQVVAALPQFQRTQPNYFLAPLPAVSNPSVNLPPNLQQSGGYQTVTDTLGNQRNIPNQSGAYETGDFAGFQQTYPTNAALQAAQQGASLPPFQYNAPTPQELRQQSGQQFQAQPSAAYAPAGGAQNLYAYGMGADELQYAGSPPQGQFKTQFV